MIEIITLIWKRADTRLVEIVKPFANPVTARETWERLSEWLRVADCHYHWCATRGCLCKLECWCPTPDDETILHFCDTCQQIRRDVETDSRD